MSKTFEDSITVTCVSPINIAVIKYWGKRDKSLILPTNSSLSATLDLDVLNSRTIITASKKFENDQFWLNGQTCRVNERMQRCIDAARSCAKTLEKDGKTVYADDWKYFKLHIHSENNFPTGAGLASSASGFACLARGLFELFNCQEEFPGHLSVIARLGSGSASRSIHGGWVKWDKGERDDGLDSIACQVANETAWPDMRVIILVVNQNTKHVSSTKGQELSVKTSKLLEFRSSQVVEPRMKEMERYIMDRDFTGFANLTMKDSNQLHAICCDTFPPIFYLDDTSKQIISLCHELNASGMKVAYSFDAGPNACLFLLDTHIPAVMSAIRNQLFHGSYIPSDMVTDPLNLLKDLNDTKSGKKMKIDSSAHHIKRIIATKVGRGAEIL
eukprot:465209_1